MGGALAGGWLKNGVPASQLCVVDPSPSDKMTRFFKGKSVRLETDCDKLEAPDILMVAVKPQIMGDVLGSLSNIVGNHTLVISIAAGKSLSFMSKYLGEGAMVRAMPNTPALVQRGISVACANGATSKLQLQQANLLLGATGSVEWVEDEGLLDAVTAVSGSGPAYVFHLVEALAQAGIVAGLPEKLASKLALETVAGAGELMMRSVLPPAKLRENVTSPGGTTQAALEILMGEDGFGQLLNRAVEAAANRSRELS